MNAAMAKATRRDFLRCAAAGAATAMLPRLARANDPVSGRSKGDRPNVILLMSDDQGWQEIGYMAPGIRTPVLDEMAAGGLRFDRYYAGHSRCSPTRACILTGRTALRTGVLAPGRFADGQGMRRDEGTLAHLFAEAGYATGHFGKYHLGQPPGAGPLSRGFQEAVWSGNHYNDGVGFRRDPGGTTVRTTGDCSEATVRVAMDFIRRAQRSGKPFFATVWFGSPHAPYTSSPQFRKLYPDSPCPEYLAEITGIDAAIGILRKELERLGVRADTQLWFCSDNGPTAQKGGLIAGAKGFQEPRISGHKKGAKEGGIRVPGLLEWPARIDKGRVVDAPVGGLDFYPTFAAMLGADPARKAAGPLDGEDIWPILNGKAGDRTKALPFWVSEAGPDKLRAGDKESALVEKRFKLFNSRGRSALYDLSRDPMERENVADQHRDVYERMVKQLQAFHESVIRCARRT